MFAVSVGVFVYVQKNVRHICFVTTKTPWISHGGGVVIECNISELANVMLTQHHLAKTLKD